MKPGKVIQQITHIVHLLQIKETRPLSHVKGQVRRMGFVRKLNGSDSDSTKWVRFLYDSITDSLITLKKAK